MICREVRRLQRWMVVNSCSESASSQPIPIHKALLVPESSSRSSWWLSPPQGDNRPKSVGLFPCVWTSWKRNHTGLHGSNHCLCQGFEIHLHHWTPWCFICITVKYLILRTYQLSPYLILEDRGLDCSLALNCCDTVVRSPVWIFRCTEMPPGTHVWKGHFWVTG